MKVKNTYSRKKAAKPKRDINVNIFNFNVYNVAFVNITNNSSSAGGKAESSKSENSDLFDKIVKGPTYHIVNNQSTFSPSESRKKFFEQRQDTITFYKSDAELSVSTDVSNHLFKDSKDSDAYSPTWESPPDYYKIKNKLVKVNKEKKIVLPKKSNRVQKKRYVARRKKDLTQLKAAPCTSSTPNRGTELSTSSTWLDTHVSPIMPPTGNLPLNIPAGHMDIGDNLNRRKQNPILSLSALIDGLGNLGIDTPHRKQVEKIANSVNQEQELFDYCSPLPSFRNQQIRALGEGSPETETDSPSKKFETESSLALDIVQENYSNSNEVLTNKSGEEGSTDSVLQISSPFRGFEEEEILKGLETAQICCGSPSSNINVYGCSENQHHSSKSNVSSEITSPIPEKVIDGHKEETDSNISSLSSTTDKDSNSSSNTKFQSGNVKTESVEKLVDTCNHQCSPPDEGKNNQDLLKYINERENWKGEEQEEDPKVSVLNAADYQESFDKELEIKIEKDDFKPPSCKKENTSSLIGLNRKCSPDKVLRPREIVNLMEINKRGFSLNKRSKRTGHDDWREKLSLQTFPSELSETLGASKINLEAGKKWRRSLLRQKQTESKFDRRASMSANILFKLIKESNILSNLTNDTKLSYNSTRFGNSALDGLENGLGLPEAERSNISFNISLSRLTRRKRRVYVHDMNEIAEESHNHSTDIFNETEFNEEQLASEPDEECVNNSEATVNQSDVFETPPILRLNPEALSVITDRKKSRRQLARSWDESSIFYDAEEENNYDAEEENDYDDALAGDENNLITSCLSLLEQDGELKTFNDEEIKLIGKVGFLARVGQQEPTPFQEAFSQQVLNNWKKIGEGVYGEVFMFKQLGEGISVIKIIPVEGSQVINGAVQKCFHEVLSELIITEEMSLLRNNKTNNTSGFCELKNKFYLKGQYPTRLLDLWHEYNRKKRSENECPDIFTEDQLYLGLELAHAGEPVESFVFNSPQQTLGVFLQTTFALAVGESAVEFEHRDLHVGNVLVVPTSEKYVPFTLNGIEYGAPTFGTKATIIDCTLSRVSFKGDVIYFDLEKDPELFLSEGEDYQFDIYRQMREDLQQNWRDHQPKTNVRWLHYLIDKFSNARKTKYKQKKTTKVYKTYMDMVVGIKDIILDFYSATDLALHLIDSYSKTVSLIKR